MHSGQHIFCGKKAQINVDNILPLNAMPEGSLVCIVEQYQGDRGAFQRLQEVMQLLYHNQMKIIKQK